MLVILTVFCLLLIQASSQVYPPAPVHFIPDGTPFTVPDVPLRTIYINPNGGNDANDGLSTSRALRTLSEAWDRVPRGALAAGQGVRLVLLPGHLGLSDIPEYWEDRWGSPSAPIILTSLSGDATSVTVGRINMFNCSHVYMMGFTIASPNDPLHCERCAGLHLRGMRVLGNVGSADTWETIKLNQCYSVYIEGCDVAGAGDNAIDMVAVQYGHVMGSAIHDANWCMYLKGGSAYFLISGNRVYDCGESGLSLGQGTGLQYMVEPWIQYEAYDIRVVNNLVYDVWGAGLGVMGGVNILMAYNTLVRVGSRSHAVEFLTGSRVCDFDDASVRCAQLRSRGGWGPTAPGQDEVPIPNLNVHFLNNIIANPPDNTTKWNHMEVRRGGTPASGGVPGPEARADTGLLIAGNMFWNGGADMPIGIDDPEDLPCPATLAPGASPPAGCMVAQLRRDNAFNPPGQLPPFLPTTATATPPSFIPATSGAATALTDPRAAAATAQAVLVAPLPAFPAWPLPSVPSGVTAAFSIPRDLAGRVRAGHDYPGAFASEGATGGASPSPSPSPFPLPSPAPSPSPSASPSPSPSPSSSPTSSPSPQPSLSPSPSPKGKGKGKPKKPVARKPKKPKKQRGRMML